jgi:hypothetical protein
VHVSSLSFKNIEKAYDGFCSDTSIKSSSSDSAQAICEGVHARAFVKSELPCWDYLIETEEKHSDELKRLGPAYMRNEYIILRFGTGASTILLYSSLRSFKVHSEESVILCFSKISPSST